MSHHPSSITSGAGLKMGKKRVKIAVFIMILSTIMVNPFYKTVSMEAICWRG